MKKKRLIDYWPYYQRLRQQKQNGLAKLIIEQQKEMASEEKFVFSPGGAKSYQKGRQGISLGARRF